MRTFDLAPLYRATVGFDRLADVMDRVMADNVAANSYPPYNIEKTAEDGWRISIAVAGFTDDELNVEVRENARRYGHHGDEPARVDVTAEADSAWVLLTVRDHGPGVPPDKLSKLTTPFYRGDTARTAATGAGLGLAIVEKSVQRLGAHLRLSNADDSGFVAQLRLKRASV